MSSKAQNAVLKGLPAARGCALGPVFVYRGEGDAPVPEYAIPPGSEDDEILRLRRASAATRRDLEGLSAALRERGADAAVGVFDSHVMLLDDPLFAGEIERLVRAARVNAESAVRRTADAARATFGRMNDPYFRERVRDVDDVARRLLRALAGFSESPAAGPKIPSIIVADDLSPSETVRLPAETVLGFATNGGSATSHVALLARAMGVPSVAGLGDVVSRVKPGDTVIVDGTEGTVVVDPDADEIRRYREREGRIREIAKSAVSAAPAGTLRGGGEVKLLANFHQGVPTASLRENGARGIGLYRSEYLWLNREAEPSEDEQYAAYREAVEASAALSPDAETVIRVLDIGGDKTLRGVSAPEPNPFLGNRSIRWLLGHRDSFAAQLRAILRASAHGRVSIMYPMVSCLEELDGAAEVLAEARASLAERGVPFADKVPVGMMVEVPAAAIAARAFARRVDFFSIGTNDLVQYTMAADRGNEAVASLYQPTHPAVVALARNVFAAAKEAGIHASVCGESASDPVCGTLWAALGADSLSMSPGYVPAMSRTLSRLSREDLHELAETALGCGEGATGGETYEACRAWLEKKIPDLAEIAR